MARFILRRVSPLCLAAVGLWTGLAYGALPHGRDGHAQFLFALVAGALAISLGALAPRIGQIVLALAGALCCGMAMGGAVLWYQTQRQWNTEAARNSHLRLAALEGRLGIDSQVTAKGNRRLDLGLSAVEWSGDGFLIRSEWHRPFFSGQLIAGAGGRLCAGITFRADSVRGGDFLWADSNEIAVLHGPGPIASARAMFASNFATAIDIAAGEAGPLAQALLLGVKDELDGEFRALFQSAGCAHLLALSGQHLSIICAFVALIGSRLARRASLVRRISLGFAWLFVWLAGPGPSLLRAVFMLSAVEVARAADRPQSSFSVLSMASLMLALFGPSSINSLSSVYSFSAMAGLMAFSEKFSALLRSLMPKSIAAALAASIAAVCGTAAVSVLTFGTFIPAGILSATAAAPVMLAFMWIALAGGLVVAFLPFAAVITAPVLGVLQRALTAVLEFGASFPIVSVTESAFARACACALIASIVAFIYAVPRRRYRASLVVLDLMRRRLAIADAKSRIALLEAREDEP